MTTELERAPTATEEDKDRFMMMMMIMMIRIVWQRDGGAVPESNRSTRAVVPGSMYVSYLKVLHMYAFQV